MHGLKLDLDFENVCEACPSCYPLQIGVDSCLVLLNNSKVDVKWTNQNGTSAFSTLWISLLGLYMSIHYYTSLSFPFYLQTYDAIILMIMIIKLFIARLWQNVLFTKKMLSNFTTHEIKTFKCIYTALKHCTHA